MVDVSNLIRVNWHGKWIWASYPTSRKTGGVGRNPVFTAVPRSEQNVFLLFRKSFTVKGKPKKIELNITVDSRYKLFINGKYLGRGINRCEAYYWYYNHYDLTPFIHEGKNVVAVATRFFGRDFAFYTQPETPGADRLNSAKGGLLFDIHAIYEDGSDEWWGSDTDTKVIRNLGERSDLPLKSGCLGFLQECDSQKIPIAWNQLNFDDNSWDKSEVYNYPIKTILLDENHPLDEKFYIPSSILKIGETDDFTADMSEDEKDEEEPIIFSTQMLIEGPHEALTHFEIQNQDAIIDSTKAYWELIPKEGASNKAFFLMVKFAKEMVGYPRIIVEGPAGAVIDIFPSEKIKENLPDFSAMEGKRGFRLTLRGGKQFYEEWDWEGFCYMLIKMRKVTSPIRIFAVGANQTHMHISKKGAFHSDNERLDRVWDACAYTLLCCAIDGYLDCPSREQRSYLGDAYPEALVANACFGEPRLTKKLIYDSCFGQRNDGIMYSFHPGDAKSEAHIIPDYTLYLIQITRDYYNYYGDEQVLVDTFPHFVRAIEWFWKYRNSEDGLLYEIPHWCFIDWSFSHDKPGCWGILNAQFSDVLEFVAQLADKFTKCDLGNKYRASALQIRQNLNKLLWNAHEGCFNDYFFNGQTKGISYATNAYLSLMGVATPDQEKLLLSRVFELPGVAENDKRQIDDFYLKYMSHHVFGADLDGFVRITQPFFMHHVHKFFAKHGRYDLLMKYLHKWEPMLDLGTTGTIWETWSIAASECHAWSATPAYDLSTYWLGITPLEPGFKSVKVAPTYYELKNVSGIYPTCNGDIQVKWRKMTERESLSIAIEIELPPAIQKGQFQVLPILNRCWIKVKAENNALNVKQGIFPLHSGINLFTIEY